MAQAGDLVVSNARVWASPEERPGPPVDLVIRNGRIVESGTASIGPRIDADGRVVTAGFTNAHVHLTEPIWRGAARASVDVLQPELDSMFLARGFTSVLDLASDPRNTGALIRRIGTGELRGPEIITAGTAIRPFRGTPYYVRDSIPWYLRMLMPAPMTGSGARRAVNGQARRGARITKLFTGSYVSPGVVRPMSPRVAAAAVAAAHARGMPVLAHPSNRAGVEIALEAGVDVLAHLPDQPAGTGAMLSEAARHGVFIVPTLHMFASTVGTDEEYLGPIRDALRAFIADDGRVLFGTDVGYMPERDTLPEISAMAAAGMTTGGILAALTVTPADLLGRADAGELRAGFRGDLVVLATRSSSPEPADLAAVHAVVRAGAIVFTAPQS